MESVAVHANDAILITDAEPIDSPGPRILYANPAFLRTTGYTLAEVIGQSPRILQGPETAREPRDAIRKACSVSRRPVMSRWIDTQGVYQPAVSVTGTMLSSTQKVEPSLR